MQHMYRRPTRVWILADNDNGPRLLTEVELTSVFTEYQDTGFEPQLGWLYENIGCQAIDVRELPRLGHLWFDDEGRFKERPENPVASALYEFCYRTGEGILGPAVLIVSPDAPHDTDQVVMIAHTMIKERKGRYAN